MTPFLDCPPDVTPFDADSYLKRAEWRYMHRQSILELDEDLDMVVQLDPGGWEAWTLKAAAAEDDDQEIEALSAAIARGAPVRARLCRVLAHLRLGNLEAAEEDSKALVRAFPFGPSGEPYGRMDRYLYPAADFATTAVDFRFGQLLWIEGDLLRAYNLFSDRRVCFDMRCRLWAHLSQLANGVRTPLSWPAPSDAPRLQGSWLASEEWARVPKVEVGPSQPKVVLWTLLGELFAERMTPDDLTTASTYVRQVANQPEHGSHRPARPGHWLLGEFVWPSQLHFYSGMWHLQRGRVDDALLMLQAAVTADGSSSLERLAARSVSRWLRQASFPSTAPVPLRRPQPRASPLVEDFVNERPLESNLWSSSSGDCLMVGGQYLGDDGIRSILNSARMRNVFSLSLNDVGLTLAGLAAFEESENVGQIKELTLRTADLAEAGLGAITQCTNLRSLQSLCFGEVGLTGRGPLVLLTHRLPSLRSVQFDEPLDFDVWLQLLEQFGDGLEASATLLPEHFMRVSPSLQICIVSVAPPYYRPVTSAELGTPAAARAFEIPESDGRYCEVTFRMLDYLRHRWARCCDRRQWNHRGGLLSEVHALNRLQGMAEVTRESALRVDGDDAFSFIDEGFDPISLHCPACSSTHVRPVAVERLPGLNPSVVTWSCPRGHVLRIAHGLPRDLASRRNGW
ncbi:hypothetical protein [Ideonella sp. A 288]|uniref:hypothetical protein n=1 Tax=Ideonella sp. A 288 TaxID=1962181 RepID=UPI0011855744|nr:hypothetical protein [Ideonella sp. A 288]